ncbi:sugar O-acetyltransferase, partial [bacterium M00.F.Ca.ET.177.01.1.1]
HPLNYQDRNQGLEQALPIHIGDNVWIGANVIVLPGVTIGNGTVIGAGSIVSKDVPENVVAIGSPAKPIKTIDNN